MVGEWGGGGVKSMGSDSVAGHVFNLIQWEYFYNNDHVLSPHRQRCERDC